MEYTIEEVSTERWCPVAGFEGVYEVSNIGRVKRVKAGRGVVVGRCLRASIDREGYPYVSLSKNGCAITRRVHQLVAVAFIGPYPVGHEVNHRDLLKPNNRVWNLEYVTRAGNIQHANDNGHATGKKILSDEAVRQIRLRYSSASVKQHAAKQMAKEFRVHWKHIENIALRRKRDRVK